MKSILDQAFKYTPSKDQTVERLRERFAQIRYELEQKKKATDAKVKPLIRAKA